MRPLSRRGVTLLELTISLTLLGVLCLAIGAVLTMSAAAGRAAVRGLDQDRLTISLATLLRHDLANADVASTGVVSPTRLDFDRPVGEARVCTSSPEEVLLPAADWRGDRQPAAGRDAAMVLEDVASAGWTRQPIIAVGSSGCPEGRAAISLTLGGSLTGAKYVRVVEPVRLLAYPSGSDDWFGLAPGDGMGVVQPFAGPLRRGETVFALPGDRLRLGSATTAGVPWRLEIPLDDR
jgi:hypothetical protein